MYNRILEAREALELAGDSVARDKIKLALAYNTLVYLATSAGSLSAHRKVVIRTVLEVLDA